MLWHLRIFRPVLLAAISFSIAVSAYAEDAKLSIQFDRNRICCIMNADLLSEKLVAIDGISSADYIERKRKIILQYDKEKIAVPDIIATISRITDVQEDMILAEAAK